jgi:putative transposase
MREHYKGYRLPKSIIGYAVRLYYRYKLSLRDVSELLLERGVEVTYETIRQWCRIFGPIYARLIRQKRGVKFKDKWDIDAMRVKIKGEIFWLWRLVDSEGDEIEILLQKRRNAKAAMRFLKKTLKRVGQAPKLLVSDKLRSYKKVHRVLLKTSDHLAHKPLNNRCENSHQPTREKEKQMRGFKSVGLTQNFLAAMGSILNLLKIHRYKNTAQIYRHKLKESLVIFNDIIALYPQSA